MKTRYAESFDANLIVLAETKDKWGYINGLYLTQETGQIIMAEGVVLEENGNIKYWSGGTYGAHKKYHTTSEWLRSLRQLITEFEEVED